MTETTTVWSFKQQPGEWWVGKSGDYLRVAQCGTTYDIIGAPNAQGRWSFSYREEGLGGWDFWQGDDRVEDPELCARLTTMAVMQKLRGAVR